MLIAYDEIKLALQAALAAHGFAGVEPLLMPIDPPRAWGVTSNVCFTLAGQAAAEDVARETEGLGKGEAKKRAGEITRSAGEQLAREIAADLVGRASLPANTTVPAAPVPPSIEGRGPRATSQGPVAGMPHAGGVAIGDARPDGASGLPVGAASSRPEDGGRMPPLPFVREVIAEGAYINFYYDGGALAAHVVEQVEQAERAEPGSFGKGAPVLKDGRPKRIMVEYAQPNTHKDFHVGHLRNASIGQAIANLLEFAGNEVLKATYIGDVGAHVAKAIWGELQYEYASDNNITEERECFSHIPDKLKSPLFYWGAIYKGTIKLLAMQKREHENSLNPLPVGEFSSDYIKPNPIFQPTTNEPLKLASFYNLSIHEIAEILHQIERAISLPYPEHYTHRWYKQYLPWYIVWKESSNECIMNLNEVFTELLLSFSDGNYFRESTVDKSKLGKQAADELKQLNIATIDTEGEYKGALYVDFAAQADAVKVGGHGGPPHGNELADAVAGPTAEPVFREAERKRIKQLGKMTILRSDGTSLYQTKELGLAKYKFDNFAIDESLYVVGAEQKLYFEQVFAILRLWGFPNAENCKHISYELVVLPTGKMSSREGNIVSYRELRDEAIARARKITEEKGIAGDVQKTAKDIAIAAIKYTMLAVTGSQQITFDFEQALSFDGRAAPYLQYAYARTRTLVEGMDAVGPTASGAGVSARQPYPVPAAPVPPSTEGQGPRARGQGKGTIEELGMLMPVGQASGLPLIMNAGGTPAPPEGESPTGPSALPEELRAETPALQEAEIALARCIARFPSVVQDAAAKYEPATLCTYLYDLAGQFAEFYRDCHVLSAPEPQRSFRQRLTLAFRNLMRAGFKLLALPLPEEM